MRHCLILLRPDLSEQLSVDNYLFLKIHSLSGNSSSCDGGCFFLEMSCSTGEQNKNTNRSCRIVCKRSSGVTFQICGAGVGSGWWDLDSK